jgi:hypothetical protein
MYELGKYKYLPYINLSEMYNATGREALEGMEYGNG